jgi:predicted alpha/beta hydrolase family esterase
MPKQVLFIHGAGGGAYEEDTRLADSLREALGADYEIIYPAMPNEDEAPYETWKQLIEAKIAKMDGPITLVGHSVGASTLLKCLNEITIEKPIAGVFLMATPFWGGDGWRYEGYQEIELPGDIAETLPKNVPLFLYQCRDDEVVPFSHLALYEKLLPQAIARELDNGGHQFTDGLAAVARDIHNLG